MGDNKDKMLSAFVIAVGFWIMNISHTSGASLWGNITFLVSGIGFLFLLVTSFNTVRNGKKNEKNLGWTFLIFALASAYSYLQMYL